MKQCSFCSHYEEPICNKYDRAPPAGFTQKCRYYDGPDVPEEIQETEAVEPERVAICGECERMVDGYCLRFDHLDYKYNFVRVKKDDECSIKS